MDVLNLGTVKRINVVYHDFHISVLADTVS